LELVAGDNELVVDTPPSGSLVITVRSAGDLEHAGSASFQIAPRSGVGVAANGAVELRGVVQQHFDAPPYRFQGLPAQDYAVLPGWPFEAAGAEIAEAVVLPGRETHVLFEL
jgi:hypothetical protein